MKIVKIIIILVLLLISYVILTFSINDNYQIPLFEMIIMPDTITPPLTITDSIPISIVMPFYNRLNFLNRSLTSVQNQTAPQIEILCVDDCSTERTSEFVIRRMQSDGRIKLVQHFYQQGSFHGRKNGVFTAKGAYIISVDSDDYLHPNSINDVYEYAKKVDADIVDYRAENIAHSKYLSHDWKGCIKNITNNTELRMKYYNKELSFNIWKRMIKRSLYIKALSFAYPFIKGKRLARTEDVISLGSVFLFTKNVYCVKFLVYVHFMFVQSSVEYGKLQSREQNSIQADYTSSLLHYFYFELKNLEDANLNDMLKNKNRSVLYNKINNISKIVKKTCNIFVPGLKSVNYSDFGYCTIEKI